jgi:RHS repeat-associated protein
MQRQDIPDPTGDGLGLTSIFTSLYTNPGGSFNYYEGMFGLNQSCTCVPLLAQTTGTGSTGELCVEIHPNYPARFGSYNSTTGACSSTPEAPISNRLVSMQHVIDGGGQGWYVYTEVVQGKVSTWKFYDFLGANNQGVFFSYTNPFGQVIQATGYSYGQILGLQGEYVENGKTEYYQLTFNTNPTMISGGTFHVGTVVLQTSPDNSTWTPVRKVNYTYYNDSSSYGWEVNLALAQVFDGSGNLIDGSYYRYYIAKDGERDNKILYGPGVAGLVKMEFGPQAFARLLAANPGHTDLGWFDGLKDDKVAPYADKFFTYNPTTGAVASETVQGTGCSCGGSSGQGTFSYTYSTNSATPSYSTWTYETVETLPDNNTNTVFSNYLGQTLLKVFTNMTTNQQWATFYRYDANDNLIWVAEPSAVKPVSTAEYGADEYRGYNDLLNFTGGKYTYLNDNTGLIHVYDYATSTTATASTPGNVQGFQMDEQVQQGQLGTPVMIKSMTYAAHTADATVAGDALGPTAYPIASETLYNGVGGEVTTYSYGWRSAAGLATTQMFTKATTRPLISTAQNGPGGTAYDITREAYDWYGRLEFSMDPSGVVTYYENDPATGSIVSKVVDMDYSKISVSGEKSDYDNTGWADPTGGLNLVSTMTVDALGRTTSVTDPNGDVTWTVYNDSTHEVRTYPGWQSASAQTSGPVIVKREDRATTRIYDETLTMAPSSIPQSGADGPPTGQETISNIQSLTRGYLDTYANRIVETDQFRSLSGCTYGPATPGMGTSGTNYYPTTFGYDVNGRRSKVVNPAGTITDTVFDGFGRPTDIWIGTNDSGWTAAGNSGSSNMTHTRNNQYDNNTIAEGSGIGEGTLTVVTQYPDSNASDQRVTENWYDFRDRLQVTKRGLLANPSSETDGMNRPLTSYTLDNLGRVTQRDLYDGDGILPTFDSSTGNYSISSSSAGQLRGRAKAYFDDQDRLYQTVAYGVGQSSGTPGNTLTTNIYYDHRGNQIEKAMPGGIVQKFIYDNAGRLVTQYATDGASGTGWSYASTVSGDDILDETLTQYDGAGNLLLTTTKKHFHNDTNTGELGTATATPLARVSYAANYYDSANRPTTRASVGTNGGSSFTYSSSSIPTPSDTALVTYTSYNPAGWVASTTDPRGIITEKIYDLSGQVTQQVDAYDGTTTLPLTASSVGNSLDRATNYTYDAHDHLYQLTALMPTGANSQTTQYNYGALTSAGSTLNSNDPLASVQYPDKTSGSPGTNASDRQVYSYNNTGQQLTYTDQNDTVHTYAYDLAGRRTTDSVSPGSGVSNQSLCQSFTYDAANRPVLSSCYTTATATGSPLDQVMDVYDGFGKLQTEYQQHGGPVSTTGTISQNVQYTYTEGSSGNNDRLLSMTYPNGRVLNYGYDNSTLDNSISRADYLSDGSGSASGTHLEDYSYLGLGTIVQRGHPQTNVNLSYIYQSGDTNYLGSSGKGDGGDQYVGLDRFGRVVDQNWWNTSTSGATDRFQYGYDRDGNALHKNNLFLSSLSELYQPSGAGESSAYDNLNRLTNFARGALSGSLNSISSPSTTSAWVLDALGNWLGNGTSQTNIGGTYLTRAYNSKNQVTTVQTSTLTFDNNGNTTTDQNGTTYTYDSWNHIVAAATTAGPNWTAFYDALGRLFYREVQGSGAGGNGVYEFYYSPQWQVIEDHHGRSRSTETVSNQYVWSQAYVDALVLRDDNSTGGSLGNSSPSSGLGRRVYAQQDANWNTTALFDTTTGLNSIQERFIYDPYGTVSYLTAAGASTTDSYNWMYLHQGGRLDTVTSLYNFRHRDYLAALGRWIETEPRGAKYVDGLNLYENERSNPVTHLDASGTDVVGPIGGSGTDPLPPPPSWGPCLNAPPLMNTAPECLQYSCTDTYSGAYASCFCQCAGNSPWDQFVRGCLRCAYNHGTDPDTAHRVCYAQADSLYPGGRNYAELGQCWLKCNAWLGPPPPRIIYDDPISPAVAGTNSRNE